MRDEKESPIVQEIMDQKSVTFALVVDCAKRGSKIIPEEESTMRATKGAIHAPVKVSIEWCCFVILQPSILESKESR